MPLLTYLLILALIPNTKGPRKRFETAKKLVCKFLSNKFLTTNLKNSLEVEEKYLMSVVIKIANHRHLSSLRKIFRNYRFFMILDMYLRKFSVTEKFTAFFSFVTDP